MTKKMGMALAAVLILMASLLSPPTHADVVTPDGGGETGWSYLATDVQYYEGVAVTRDNVFRDTPDYVSRASCIEWSSWPTKKRVCMKAVWFKQPDGSGVNLWAGDLRTINGCDDLEDDDGGRRKFSHAEEKWQQPGKTARAYRWIGYHGCDPAFYSSWKGADYGPMVYRFRTKARVFVQTDSFLCWKWTLYPNGTYDVYTERKSTAPAAGDDEKCNEL